MSDTSFQNTGVSLNRKNYYLKDLWEEKKCFQIGTSFFSVYISEWKLAMCKDSQHSARFFNAFFHSLHTENIIQRLTCNVAF